MRLPIRASVLRNLRVRARQFWRQLNCPHTHTFDYCLNGAQWSSSGQRKGEHRGLKITGCYLCGQLWVEDWMA